MDDAAFALRAWITHLQGAPSEASLPVGGSPELRELCLRVHALSASASGTLRGDMVRDAFWGGMRGELDAYLSGVAQLDSELGGLLAGGGGDSGAPPRAPRFGGALQRAALGGAAAGAAAAAPPVVVLPTAEGASWLLRRLHAWAVERLPLVRALLALARAAEHQRGAALCTSAHAHCGQGDARVRAALTRVFAAASAPLHAALRAWALRGAAPPPGGGVELCVEELSAREVEDAGPWAAGPRLARAHLPAYVPEHLADAAVRLGKAVRYLREVNGDAEWVREHVAPFEAGGGGGAAAASVCEDAALATTALPSLWRVVRCASPVVDYRCVQQLLGRHRALAHLQILHRYVLLTQGDFAASLLAGARSELDRPAAGLALVLHSLGGVLEAAVRSSNAALEDRALVDCLHVRLAPPPGGAGGATGWDVFTLSYHVAPPLAALLPARALATYGALFSLLWTVRRAEAALSELWNVSKATFTVIEYLGHAGLARLLHAAALSRMHMGHFVSCLCGYLMLGVLSPAWAALEAAVGAAGDVDAVLDAHGAYLDALCTRVLLLDAAGGARDAAPPLPARAALDSALHAVLRFTREVAAILLAAEPLAEEARGMGIRTSGGVGGESGGGGGGALTADAAAAADEARALLCSKLDVLVKRRGPEVAELTAAYRAQLDRLLGAFEALESRCVGRRGGGGEVARTHTHARTLTPPPSPPFSRTHTRARRYEELAMFAPLRSNNMAS
jgi:hypothetical protein